MPKIRRHNHIYDVLSEAISVLEQYPEHHDVVEQLKYERSLLKPPRWTESAIVEAVDTFVQTYGRIPTTEDLKHDRSLPTHASIKLRFGITAAEWLTSQYPQRKLTYADKKRVYTEQFALEYRRLKPSGPKDFETRRDKSRCRTWVQVAKYYNCTSWKKLIAMLDLPTYINGEEQHGVTVQVYTDI